MCSVTCLSRITGESFILHTYISYFVFYPTPALLLPSFLSQLFWVRGARKRWILSLATNNTNKSGGKRYFWSQMTCLLLLKACLHLTVISWNFSPTSQSTLIFAPPIFQFAYTVFPSPLSGPLNTTPPPLLTCTTQFILTSSWLSCFDCLMVSVNWPSHGNGYRLEWWIRCPVSRIDQKLVNWYLLLLR